MKKIVLGIVAVVGIGGSIFASDVTVAQAQSAVDCSALTADEEQFATGLSPSNQMLFCRQFNGDQRSAAMQMVGQQDEYGNQMSANQAVAKVAQDNSITPMPKTPPARRQGGCPMPNNSGNTSPKSGYSK